ncbi:MAG: RNA methyltransferase, partial [Bifidobacteriaceae bacterium]|nr:RNA methyltransferase [Bifidobacteriaceae bacterium]
MLADSQETRNLVDKYRFWENDKIKKDMAKNARPFEIAVENLQRDFNVGSIIRTANAFAAQAVHIVGRRSVNRRGAMVTDKYLNMNY